MWPRLTHKMGCFLMPMLVRKYQIFVTCVGKKEIMDTEVVCCSMTTKNMSQVDNNTTIQAVKADAIRQAGQMLKLYENSVRAADRENKERLLLTVSR